MVDVLPPEVEAVSLDAFDYGSTTYVNCGVEGPPTFDDTLAFCRETGMDPGYFSMTFTVRAVALGPVTNTAVVRYREVPTGDFYWLTDLDPRNNSSPAAVTVIDN